MFLVALACGGGVGEEGQERCFRERERLAVRSGMLSKEEMLEDGGKELSWS
jgi:hypothetical protein